MRPQEYLEQYLDCKCKVEQIDEQLKTVSESIDSLSINYSGMPHGSDIHSKVEDYVIRMEDKRETLLVKRSRLVEVMMEVADTIRNVEDKTYSTLLYLRYILDLKWDDVADSIGYDESYTRGYLHGKSLLQIKVPTQSNRI